MVWKEVEDDGNQQVTQTPNTPKKHTEAVSVPPRCHSLKWPKLSIWSEGESQWRGEEQWREFVHVLRREGFSILQSHKAVLLHRVGLVN